MFYGFVFYVMKRNQNIDVELPMPPPPPPPLLAPFLFIFRLVFTKTSHWVTSNVFSTWSMLIECGAVLLVLRLPFLPRSLRTRAGWIEEWRSESVFMAVCFFSRWEIPSAFYRNLNRFMVYRNETCAMHVDCTNTISSRFEERKISEPGKDVLNVRRRS